MTNKSTTSKPTALKLVASKTKPREKEDLPLDDPRWLPLIPTHNQLAERLGSPELAAFKLNMALLNKKLRCKWVATTVYGEGLTPGAFWSEHQISCGSEGARVTFRPPRDDTDVEVVRSLALIDKLAKFPKPTATPPRLSPEEEARRNKRLSELACFLWEPDLKKFRGSSPASARNKPEPADKTEVDWRPGPGPRITKNWKLFVAAELYRIVGIEGKIPPKAEAFVRLCSSNLNYDPDPSDVREVLRALRELF